MTMSLWDTVGFILTGPQRV
uniref:Uncharacterized protein n=1 Tax=Anguilla anguilla TaxID=7936 RepID=A0A0E9SQ60_ANGAN